MTGTLLVLAKQPLHIFLRTLAVVASIGAFVPVLFGTETVGQLKTVSEGVPELA
jgi:hypothetical protein